MYLLTEMLPPLVNRRKVIKYLTIGRRAHMGKRAMGGETLSGSALREAMQQRGLPLGHEQMMEYVRWGFIEEPRGGRWPADHLDIIADRIGAVRDLERFSRSLPRRAVLLSPGWRAHNGYRLAEKAPNQYEPVLSGYSLIHESSRGYEVPPEAFRAAMLDTLPTIFRPGEAIYRLHVAALYLAERYPHPFFIMPRKPGDAYPFSPPPVQEWASVLTHADAAQIAERRGIWYDLASFLYDETWGTPNDVTSIPAEDTIVLLAVRDLSTTPPRFADSVDDALFDRLPYVATGDDDPVLMRQRARRSRAKREEGKSETPRDGET